VYAVPLAAEGQCNALMNHSGAVFGDGDGVVEIRDPPVLGEKRRSGKQDRKETGQKPVNLGTPSRALPANCRSLALLGTTIHSG
jgi:hypothetical protein